MTAKRKIIGFLIIIIGILPFLLKIQSIADAFSKYTFLAYLTPGEPVYQIILIVLGVLLIWRVKPRIVTH